jgi:hypothetical protein
LWQVVFWSGDRRRQLFLWKTRSNLSSGKSPRLAGRHVLRDFGWRCTNVEKVSCLDWLLGGLMVRRIYSRMSGGFQWVFMGQSRTASGVELLALGIGLCRPRVDSRNSCVSYQDWYCVLALR